MTVVKKSSEFISYRNGDREITYFNIIGVNGREVYHVRIYQKAKFTMVRVGVSYKFVGILKKGEGWWCVSTSSIAYAKPVASECSIVLVLPEDEPKAGSKRSIREALGSPQKSTVVAKILKVLLIIFYYFYDTAPHYMFPF